MKNFLNTMRLAILFPLLCVTADFSATTPTQVMYLCNEAVGIQALQGITSFTTLATVPTTTSVLALALSPNKTTGYGMLFTGATLYAFNMQNNTLITSISTGMTGSSYQSGVVTPNSNYAYFVTQGTLCAVSTATNTTLAGSPYTLTGITNAYDVVINSTGTTLYVSDAASKAVLPIPINPSTGIPTVTGPSFNVGTSSGLLGIALTPDDSTLYVINNSDSKIYPVTNLTGSPTVGTGASITSPSNGPILINPSGTTAYFLNSGNALSVFDLTSHTVTTSITLGVTGSGTAQNAAMSTDGSYVYVTTTSSSPNGALIVVSAASNGVTATYAGYNGLAGVAVTQLDGSLDTAFGTSGFTLTPVSRADTITANAVLTGASLDKILLAGTSQTTNSSLFLAQYTSSGILDTANFNSSSPTNPGYQVIAPSQITLPTTALACIGNAIAVNNSTNKILVAGYATQSPTNLLLTQFTSAGILDTSFGTSNGYITQSVGTGAVANAVGIQSTNKIVVGGSSVNNGLPNFTLARFSSAGALDASFGASGITTTVIGLVSSISSLAIIPSTVLSGSYTDYIIAVGNVDNQITIARYTDAGILDTGFGSSGIFQPTIAGASTSTAYTVLIDTSGNILIAGSANISGISQSLLIRCLPAGSLDTTFNSTGYVLQSISYGSEYYSLVLQTNGDIIAGGYACSALANQISMARYFPSGSLDVYYGTNGISLTSTGIIAAAGTVGIQSTQNAIAAGTADDTIYIARFTS